MSSELRQIGFTEAGQKLLDELAESPLPGARYAYTVVKGRLARIEAEARTLDTARAGEGLDVERLIEAERRATAKPDPKWRTARDRLSSIAHEYASLHPDEPAP